ncbi:MAG: GyrI-like domain-containing protein [Thaumarchaeota archaeon]|nr:MAG: GyrI-like domain-containing protein [Nitrososphaerota archaeon]
MLVDFKIKKFSGCRVASVTYVGPYREGGDMMREEFNQIVKWARKNRVRTGRWFFAMLDESEIPDKKRRWEAAIEVKGAKAEAQGGIRFREFADQLVASVTFDPEKVSPRVIYYGLEGWLEQRRKDREYKSAGPPREVYTGDPWRSARAWANVEVQVPVKKLR